MADETGSMFPIIHIEVGDVFGITVVHVKRSAQDVRRKRLIQAEGYLDPIGWDGLRRTGDLSGEYPYRN